MFFEGGVNGFIDVLVVGNERWDDIKVFGLIEWQSGIDICCVREDGRKNRFVGWVLGIKVLNMLGLRGLWDI